jgi:hypothetical protein
MFTECWDQVWRLPGEKIHRIMGVTDVDATPDICTEYSLNVH